MASSLGGENLFTYLILLTRKGLASFGFTSEHSFAANLRSLCVLSGFKLIIGSGLL